MFPLWALKLNMTGWGGREVGTKMEEPTEDPQAADVDSDVKDVEPVPLPRKIPKGTLSPEDSKESNGPRAPKGVLSPEQTAAVTAAKARKNIFITGPGGTGKSHLLKVLVEELKQMGREVAVTALTGCAALLLSNMPGMPVKAKTLHSWAGIGLGRGSLNTLVGTIMQNFHKKKAWLKTDTLIVDEISMLTPTLLDTLDQIGRLVRKRPFQPMGGLQVIFVGDFYQLPPVGREDPERTFAFQSAAWPQLIQETIQLRTIFRQTDPVFHGVLSEARRGALSANSYEVLEGRRTTSWRGQLIRPTLLFTRNADVDAINKKQFGKLQGAAQIFKAKTTFSKVGQTEKGLEKHIEFMDKDAPYVTELELKVGAQVMLVRNMDPDAGLMNGSRGVVTSFSEATGWPIVRFASGATIEVKPMQWESDTDPSFFREQIPLRLAWAYTIHRSQGASLDAALVDIGKSTFEFGQAYVALSRVRSLEGLWVYDLDATAFRVHPAVEKFYQGLA